MVSKNRLPKIGREEPQNNTKETQNKNEDEGKKRRQVVKTGGLLALLGLSGGTFLITTTENAEAQSDLTFTAADVSVEDDNGEVESVSIAPQLDIHWSNFSNGVSSIDFQLDAHIPSTGSTDTIYDLTFSSEGDSSSDSVQDAHGGNSGSYDFSYSDAYISVTFTGTDITATGSNITDSTFSNTSLSDGSSETTDVELQLSATVNGSNGETSTLSQTVTFTVTLTNPTDGTTSASGDFDGSANTSAS